ncbi:MAG TPA: hypothetical protein VNM48_01545 [Chloroflexota bacterium]|nr:hypothetical protein [Chloroflexota bacterium]
MATSITRQDEMTLEQFLENAKSGILDDRLDAIVPLHLFGRPTEAERAEARR